MFFLALFLLYRLHVQWIDAKEQSVVIFATRLIRCVAGGMRGVTERLNRIRVWEFERTPMPDRHSGRVRASRRRDRGRQ